MISLFFLKEEGYLKKSMQIADCIIRFKDYYGIVYDNDSNTI